MPSVSNTKDQWWRIAARPPVGATDALLAIAAIFSLALAYLDRGRFTLYVLLGLVEIVAIVTGRISRRLDAILAIIEIETQRRGNPATAESRDG